MTADRWSQIERVCQAALERAPAARAACLDDACAGDADLRREVESLLAQQSQADAFLATPAMEAAAQAFGASEALRHGTRLGAYEIDALIAPTSSRSESSSTRWRPASGRLPAIRRCRCCRRFSGTRGHR